MATVTGLTAERMQEIIDATIVDADVISGHLILTLKDGNTIDAGLVSGVSKGPAFPGTATDGDLFVRTDQVGDPMYKYTDGAWTLIGGGGITKVSAFPTVPAPTDGDMVIRTDMVGDPLFKFTDGVWEQQPRMGAQTVPSSRVTIAAVNVSIPHNVNTAISFDTEDIDTDTMHDNAVNPTRLTVRTPGLYLVSAAMGFTATAVGQRVINLGFNGVLEAAENDGQPGTGAHSSLQTGTIKRLAAGDYIELVVFQNSGAPINSNGKPILSATWLGGAGQTVDERGSASVKVLNPGAQSIPNGVATALTFDTELWDTDSIHDTVVNPSRFTAKTPGLYCFHASLDWTPNATGLRQIWWTRNGANLTEFAHVTDEGSASAAANRMQGQVTLQLAAGDYVEFVVYQTSGGALTVPGSQAVSAFQVASGKTVTPFARARKSAQQSIPHNVLTVVSWNTEDVDNDGIHDLVTNNNRLTCRTAGVYIAQVESYWQGSATGRRQTFLNHYNSAGVMVRHVALIDNPPLQGADPYITTSGPTDMAVGDYLQVEVIQDSGAALMWGLADDRTSFSMVKVGSQVAPGGYAPVAPSKVSIASIGWAAGFTDDTTAFVTKNAEGFVKFSGGAFRSVGAGAIAAGVTMFTLPPQFRPAERQEFMVQKWNTPSASNGGYMVRVGTDGVVTAGVQFAGFGNVNESDRITLANVGYYAS